MIQRRPVLWANLRGEGAGALGHDGGDDTRVVRRPQPGRRALRRVRPPQSDSHERQAWPGEDAVQSACEGWCRIAQTLGVTAGRRDRRPVRVCPGVDEPGTDKTGVGRWRRVARVRAEVADHNDRQPRICGYCGPPRAVGDGQVPLTDVDVPPARQYIGRPEGPPYPVKVLLMLMATSPQVGDPFPDISLPRLGGGELSPRSLRGRRLLLFFWGSW